MTTKRAFGGFLIAACVIGLAFLYAAQRGAFRASEAVVPVDRVSVPDLVRDNSATKAAAERTPAKAEEALVEQLPEFPETLMNATKEVRPLAEQREWLLSKLENYFELDRQAVERLSAVFFGAPYLGQGLPEVTVHPMTRGECLMIRAELKLADEDRVVCGSKNMSKIPGPVAHGVPGPGYCIDRFEFPNIPCEYPLTWVPARDAAAICEAVGKRLCDAHEWEDSCGGQVRTIEQAYEFGKARMQAEYGINQSRPVVWSYGPTKNHSLCATGSQKSPSCVASGLRCGSNTYPAGSFPDCKSRFSVYDQHGNAAEHMNLPLSATELTSRGGIGSTEMKGSWFIFQSYEAHPDDCYWRARNWHGSKVNDPASHANYHLGFRCCKSL